MDRSSNVIAMSPVGITIGAMSRATGIPANTLRTWERRYGFPAPDRTDSGQRLYSPALIGHLRLIAQALESGHRPRQVLGLSFDQLSELMGAVRTTEDSPTTVPAHPEVVGEWIDAVRRLDSRALDTGLRTEAARLGLLRFLTDRAGPLMVALGAAWQAGVLQVYQEHWASERLRRFLTDNWMPLAAEAIGPKVVAAGLPGDRHDLGLHMATCIMAMCGWRVAFLGRDTPTEDIAAATETSEATAVLVSVSAWTDPEHSAHALYDLRSRIDSDIDVIVGGSGAPTVPAGVHGMRDLDQLYAWASRQQD